MMHSAQNLYDQMTQHLGVVNRQLADMREDLDKQISILPYPEGVSHTMMRNSDGSYVLADMLAAKAQLLSGMAALKAAELANKAPRPGGRR